MSIRLLAVLSVALAPSLLAQSNCTMEKRTTAQFNGMPYDQVVALSPSGRYLVFNSDSPNLVPGDTNGAHDVFLVDRHGAGTIQRVTFAMNYAEPNGSSLEPSVSDDGRYVVFTSFASNLVPGDTGNNTDVFVRDRFLGTTRRLSVTPTGAGGNGPSLQPRITPDGRYVVFNSKASNLILPDADTTYDIYVCETATGDLQRVTVGVGGALSNGDSFGPAISADGRVVAFSSHASNLVAEPTSAWVDVFVVDRASGVTRVGSSSWTGGPSDGASRLDDVSADGRVITFRSYAENMHPGDTDDDSDQFARDMTTGTCQLVSATPAGVSGDDVSWYGALSSNGRFVVFASFSGDLLPGPLLDQHQRIYVRDLWLAQTRLVSVRTDGTPSAEDGFRSAISADGGVLAFTSRDPQLALPFDPDTGLDVFVRECSFDVPTTYCVAQPDSVGCVPHIGSTGTPSASSPAAFDVTLQSTRSQRAGMLFYSTSGPALSPMPGGQRCVQQVVWRTSIQYSGGSSSGQDCTGAFSYDFNARIRSGLFPGLSAGGDLWAQYWSRDPGAPASVHLSDALAFHIAP